MNEKELFLEGHKELIKMLRWINAPIAYIPRYADIRPQDVTPGTLLYGDEAVGHGIEILTPLGKETNELIIKTFADSHARLKNE